MRLSKGVHWGKHGITAGPDSQFSLSATWRLGALVVLTPGCLDTLARSRLPDGTARQTVQTWRGGKNMTSALDQEETFGSMC